MRYERTMPYEEVIRIIRRDDHCNKDCIDCPSSLCTIKITKLNAIECIKKQIPKKPIIIGDGEDLCAHCECGQHLDCTYPNSNKIWRNGKTHKFCLNCGQAIDWSGVE